MVKTSPFKAGGEGLIPGQGVKGLPWWLSDKESACNVGDLGSVLGSRRSPGGGHGNPLQYLAWRIPWTEEPDGLPGPWVAKSQTRLSS